MKIVISWLNKKTTWVSLLLTCLIAVTYVVPASAKSQNSQQWDDWRTMGKGYIARRKVPANHKKKKAQRRSAKVDDRNYSATVSNGKAKKTSFGGVSRSVQSLSAATKNTLLIKTQGEGLFSIPLADIAAVSGYSLNKITKKARRRGLTLRNDNKPVRWMYYPDTQSLLFMAEDFDTFYTEQNAFQLTLRRTPDARRMFISKEKEGPDNAAEYGFLETLKFEEEPDLYYVFGEVLADEPDADYWFWDFLFGGFRENIQIPLDVLNPADSGTAQFRINLRGATDAFDGDEHQVYASINGENIGSTIVWDGFEAATLVVDFDQSLLQDGENILGLHGVYAGDASIQYLDDIELDYVRKPIARNGSLMLSGLQKQTEQLVTGFTSDQILVIKRPNTRPAARRDITIFEEPDGTFSVAFFTKNATEYFVSQVDSVLSVDVMDEDISSSLADNSNSVDYLIIAPRVFNGTAEALQTYREGDFSTKIAWLDDIYDEFSAGRVDPFAITRFLQHAQSNWALSPSMVVILGKGTVDHKDRMQYGDSFVPVVFTDTPWAQAASDDRLLNGDEVADFSIGRIPMISDAQGLAYIEKLKRHDTQMADDSRSTAVLVADNPDDAGDFHTNSDLIADELINTYSFDSVVKHYAPQSPSVNSQMKLDSTWETGLVSYDGHGSTTQVGNGAEDYILASDAVNLSNANYPVFAALTCAAGNYVRPGETSLAGALVMNPNGGAVASYAPTGLSLDDDAQTMAHEFISSLYGSGNRIGVSVKDSKINTELSTRLFMRRIYSVVGDPATYAR